MTEEFASRIVPGMDVCDTNGEKIGTVNHVYQHAMVGGGANDPAHEDFFSIKTGLFGLGKHLYVPFNAIQEMTDGCVFIAKPKDALEGLGWDVKPIVPEGKD